MSFFLFIKNKIMKPLIKAIPSKTFEHRGETHMVYKMISVSSRRDGSIALSVYLKGVRKQVYGSTNTKTQSAVQVINSFVEQNWQGDRFTPMKLSYTHGLDGSVVVSRIARDGSDVLAARVKVKVIGTNGWKCHSKYLGISSMISNDEINKKLNDHIAHHNVRAKEYNTWLENKHKTFRELVEAQIMERDRRCERTAK